jgi:hypothetical protein
MPNVQTLKPQELAREQLFAALSIFRSFGWMVEQDLQSLPRYVDDAERDFGMDIYDRMMRDDSLSSSVDTIKAQVMSEGPKFLCSVSAPASFSNDAEAQGKYDKAEEIRSDFESMCDNLQQPLEDILMDMLDALVYGHRIAEEVYAAESGKLVLKKLRVKERESYCFAVNKYMDLAGILPQQYGNSSVGNLSIISEKDIIPRDKFFILSYKPKGGDPRGRSILRPAYNAWYQKTQLWPHYFKYLLQFATPGIAAIGPPDAAYSMETDETGNNVEIKPEEAILNQLLAFANGTAVVLPHGSDIKPIQAVGNGEAYLKAFEMFDRRCVRTVLLNTRSVMEAQFGSKADSQTGQDLLGTVVQLVRRWVEISFYRDVIKPWFVYNYGEDMELCPVMSLSSGNREDRVALMQAVAALWNSGYLDESMCPGLDADMSLPERDMEAFKERQERQRDRDQMLSGILPDDSDDEPIKKKRSSSSVDADDEDEIEDEIED